MTSTISIKDYGDFYHNRAAKQLKLFNLTGNRQKPQIISIPGISTKERNRYRVTLGDRILGDQLAIDDALKLANQSTHH
jgi:hypothetical protein